MKQNKGPELWKKAKKLIPGGTQLLSKRSEQFLPELWPSYYKKAKGIEIWDLEDNRYLDMSLMGVGTCVLGYADEDVNRPVKEAIDLGAMSTLNCYEEVELAESLLKLDNWAGSVRYARTGGEAMSVAVRIARACSGKDKIAFSGYHGWHDWYLASNLADDSNLDGHLLPGLNPLGVPRGLINTALPFNYNHIEELENIVEAHDIGTIVMEPLRHFQPEPGFLKAVRKIADEIGAVLVFDEISSGFRMTVGGAYSLFDVKPDIVVYGKAMSNGYPMAAIVGREEIMDIAQSSFISSTYWTDRVGPVAAVATIEKLRRDDIPSKLRKNGLKLSAGWKKLSEEHNLPIMIFDEGLESVPSFAFEDAENNMALRTLFTQEMLERGYLASNISYQSGAHNEEHIAAYIENAGEVFALISEAVENNTFKSLLKAPVAHSGFKKIT